MQSLFSLEVIVNFVKLYKSPSISCLFPCVAFRLLDYPTIAIQLVDNHDANELRSKLEITSSQIDKLPFFVELLDRHGRFLFAKGKSCLFRAEMPVLKRHLQSTPMYLMVLDTFFEPYKLIGTTLIPLTNLINEIHKETSEFGDDIPCTKMTHGVFEVRNLMGEEVGQVSFVTRLSCFGAALIPHLPATTENSQRKLKAVEIEVKKKTNDDENLNEIETFRYELKKPPNNLKKNALVQTVNIDYKDTKIEIGDKKSDSKLSEFKTERKSSLDTSLVEPAKVIEPDGYQIKPEANFDEFVVNYFCPPALHYNSNFDEKNNRTKVSNTNLKVVEQKVFMHRRVEYLRKAKNLEIEDLNDQDEEQNENLKNIVNMEEKAIEIVKNENFNFDQTPLLKCLFDEISMLKNKIDHNSHNTKNPKKVVNETRVKNDEKNRQVIKVSNTNGDKSKPLKNTTGILKKNFINNNKETIRIKSGVKKDKVLSHDETPVGPKQQVSAKKPPVLKYGTTNTHRMRVLANNPNKAREIEIKHEKLLTEIKWNLDELNLSSNGNSGEGLNESVRKNLEKVLFESTGSTFSDAAPLSKKGANLKNTNKSMGNLSLLNKVDIESTNDYTMLREGNKMEEVSVNSPTKMVQFGHTYVMNNSSNTPYSDSSTGGQNSPNTNKQISENVRKSEEYEESTTVSKNLNRNIFLENRNSQYDEDFVSSVESSSLTTKNTTQSNFFTPEKKDGIKEQNDSNYEEEDWEIEEEEEEVETEDEKFRRLSNNRSESKASSSKFSSDDYS